MSFRFFKRIRIFPGVYLNFGKNGVSVSFGPRGLKTTIGRKGIKHSIGVPGTGIRYETRCQKPLKSEVVSVASDAPTGDNVHRLQQFLSQREDGDSF